MEGTECPKCTLNIDELVDIESEELVRAKRELFNLIGASKFDWNDPKLLPALRIYHFNERELTSHQSYLLYDGSSMDDKLTSLKFISPRNEQRCLLLLWKRLSATGPGFDAIRARELSIISENMQKLLRAYPNTMDPKGTILSDESSSKFHQYVGQWRFSEQNSNRKLADFGGVRGLLTETPIAPTEAVLRLPVEHIFGYHSIAKSPLKVLYDVEGLPSEVALALFLIFEFYNDQSAWRAYLDMLPMEFDTALYYTAQELAQFSDSLLHEEILSMQKKATETFEAVVPVLMAAYPQLFHPKIFVFENWVWAQSVLDSRGIRLNLNGSASLCLLPLVDAINGTSVSFLDGITSVNIDANSEDSYTINTLVPLDRGEQITMCYGAFSNRELLLYYGYVESGENEYDTFSFDLEVDDGPAGDVQTHVLAQLGLSLDQHIAFDGTVSPATLMTMYIILMSPEELLNLESFKSTRDLGVHIYNEAVKCVETRASLRTVLNDLQACICIPDASSSDVSTRINNVHLFLSRQRRIIRNAVQKL